MSRQSEESPVRQARETVGYSREKVAAQLDPPVSAKTIERWEDVPEKVKTWRLRQLADVYGVELDDLRSLERTEAA